MRKKKKTDWSKIGFMGLAIITGIVIAVLIQISYYYWFKVPYTPSVGKESIIISIEAETNLKPKDIRYVLKADQLGKFLNALEKIKNEQSELNKKFLDRKATKDIDVSRLNGFYASLFTFIAVIIGIAAMIGWRRMQELSEKLKEFKEIEDKVDFLYNKKKYADWAKEKVDKLGLNTFEIKKMEAEDKKRLDEIKEYVIEDLTDSGWLELLLARQIMKDKDFKKAENFKKAESILNAIIDRDLLDERSEIQSFLYHSKGVLHWETYRHDKKDKKWNYFTSDDKNLKKPKPKTKKEAISLLENAIGNYNKSIDFANKREINSKHSDPSLANLALVQIELSKFYYYQEGKKDKKNPYTKCLNEALDNLEKITEKDHNTYYDMARAYYYKDDMTQAKKCFDQFQKRLDFFSDKEKFEIRNRFEEYMETECKEFGGEGFPAKLDECDDFKDKDKGKGKGKGKDKEI